MYDAIFCLSTDVNTTWVYLFKDKSSDTWLWGDGTIEEADSDNWADGQPMPDHDAAYMDPSYDFKLFGANSKDDGHRVICVTNSHLR